LRRLIVAGIRLNGASDHGVSEALYLRDPDENGVELYWDRPQEEWPRSPDGKVAMFNRREVKGDSHQIWRTQRGPRAATKLDQPHRDREGMCAITMLCVCSPTVATLTPCHKIGCKIVHSVQDFHN